MSKLLKDAITHLENLTERQKVENWDNLKVYNVGPNADKYINYIKNEYNMNKEINVHIYRKGEKCFNKIIEVFYFSIPKIIKDGELDKDVIGGFDEWCMMSGDEVKLYGLPIPEYDKDMEFQINEYLARDIINRVNKMK